MRWYMYAIYASKNGVEKGRLRSLVSHHYGTAGDDLRNSRQSPKCLTSALRPVLVHIVQSGTRVNTTRP